MTQLDGSVGFSHFAMEVIRDVIPAKMHRAAKRDCRNGRAMPNGISLYRSQLNVTMEGKMSRTQEGHAMTVLMLDSATAERLKAMHGEVQLCDPQGVIVGRAIAVGETPPYEIPFTREELEASEMREGGCTLEELLPLLEKCRAEGLNREEVSARISRLCEETSHTLRIPSIPRVSPWAAGIILSG